MINQSAERFIIFNQKNKGLDCEGLVLGDKNVGSCINKSYLSHDTNIGGNMMNKMIWSIVFTLFAFVLVQNRYRLMNLILGQNQVRHFLIKWLMKIPYFRTKFIRQAF